MASAQGKNKEKPVKASVLGLTKGLHSSMSCKCNYSWLRDSVRTGEHISAHNL